MRAGANICGVLVHAVPAKVEGVEAALALLPGVEIHGNAEVDASGAGRIIVTVEDTAECLALDTLGRIHRQDGVVAAALVYHHFDADFASENGANPNPDAGDACADARNSRADSTAAPSA